MYRHPKAQVVVPVVDSLSVATVTPEQTGEATSSRTDPTGGQVRKGLSSATKVVESRECYHSEISDEIKAQVKSVQALLEVIGQKLAHRSDLERITSDINKDIEEFGTTLSDMIEDRIPTDITKHHIRLKANELLTKLENDKQTLESVRRSPIRTHILHTAVRSHSQLFEATVTPRQGCCDHDEPGKECEDDLRAVLKSRYAYAPRQENGWVATRQYWHISTTT